MNNEIKEILAYFEEYIKITDMHDSEPMLNWKDLKIVLDYITNLQEDLANYVNVVLHDRKVIDDYKSRIDKAIEEINYMITNADITEISAIKLKQILGDKGEDKE